MIIELPALFDAHVHFRQDDLLQFTAPETARYCEYALAMPNTIPAITSEDQAVAYKAKINKYAPNLKVLAPIKLTKEVTPEALSTMKIDAVKLYPGGVTTNSENGYTAEDFQKKDKTLYDCLDVLDKRGIPLLVHAEMPGASVLNREHEFLYILREWLKLFRNLRMVVEHVSTKAGVEFIGKWPEQRVCGTITLHHLMLTLDDIIGDKLRPHYFCKPIPKMDDDRHALLLAAMSGKPKFFLGSDSAPHTVHTKLCDHGCAGVFTAPRLVEMLVALFAKHNKLEQLPYFSSIFGRSFYNLPTTASWNIQVEEVPLVDVTAKPVKNFVPLAVGPFVPFMAGEILGYKML